MTDSLAIRLYLFEGVPCFTDAQSEGELLKTDVYVQLRRVRFVWRSSNRGRDPRYLVYIGGVAYASSSMGRCRLCDNERPRIGDILLCQCSRYAATW